MFFIDLMYRLWNKLTRIQIEVATDQQLALAHSQSHIKKVRDTIYSDKLAKGKLVELEKGENTWRFPSSYENMHTARSAYLAAGGTIEAVRAVC